MTPLDHSELAHYGVLGMKWGVRKNPDRAYSKSIKKLRRIDSAHAKAQARVAKAQKKGLENKAQKLANRSANLERKSVKLQSKSNRLYSKAGRYERKAEKYRDKAVRSFSLKKRVKMTEKMEKAAAKSYRLSDKGDRLADKSAKLDMKSRKLDSKSKNISYQVYKVNYKEKKLQDKGKKWVERMNKEFSSVSLKDVSREDIDYGKSRAVEIASRFDSKAKHGDTMDDIFTGVLTASEVLAHYGVKGMKWGVHKAAKEKKSESSENRVWIAGGSDDLNELMSRYGYEDELPTSVMRILLLNVGQLDDIQIVETGYLEGKFAVGDEEFPPTLKGLEAAQRKLLDMKKEKTGSEAHGLGKSREKRTTEKSPLLKATEKTGLKNVAVKTEPKKSNVVKSKKPEIRAFKNVDQMIDAETNAGISKRAKKNQEYQAKVQEQLKEVNAILQKQKKKKKRPWEK